MQRLSVLAALLVAAALLVSPGSAMAASAQPLSPAALAYPAAFTPTPGGGRILYGERYTGRVMRLSPATGTSTPFFTIPNVASTGDQGLLGLAVSRNYPDDARVWALATRTVSGAATNQLLRIRADDRGFAVLRNLPTATSHDGGR